MGRKKRVKLACLAAAVVLLLYLSTHVNAPQRRSRIKSTGPWSLHRLASWWRSSKGAPWKPRKVLLFTYARSGSSFTGDIIHYSPDVYYVFEPLRASVNSKQLTLQKKDAIMQGFFTCNLSTVPLKDIYEHHMKIRKDYKTAQLTKCFRLLHNATLLHPCIKEAELNCKRHRLVAIKTIRYPIAAAKQLMTLNPDLVVIFLVRDPRGNFWSRMRVFRHPKPAGIKQYAKENCRAMLRDTQAIREMFRAFQHRIRFLRYEDLARKPVEVSRNIYDFLHLAWTDQIQSTVVKHTSRSAAAGNATRANQKPPNQTSKTRRDSAGKVEKARGVYEYDTTRPDSYQAAISWRAKIFWEVSVAIEKECREVMNLWGYSPFHSLGEIRNGTVSNQGRFKLLDMLDSSDANLGENTGRKSRH